MATRNVAVLLRKIEQANLDLQGMYMRDLHAKEVSDELVYTVRAIVQDCQSVLDWTATAVKMKYNGPGGREPYFPLRGSEPEFWEEIEKQIKGLRAKAPDVAAAFERHQPYRVGKMPLSYLHALARVNKHRDFAPQVRHEIRQWTQRTGGGVVSWGAGVTWTPGSVFIGGRPMGDPTTTTVAVYVDWRFVDPSVSVLPTLEALGRLAGEAAEDVGNAAAL